MARSAISGRPHAAAMRTPASTKVRVNFWAPHLPLLGAHATGFRYRPNRAVAGHWQESSGESSKADGQVPFAERKSSSTGFRAGPPCCRLPHLLACRSGAYSCSKPKIVFFGFRKMARSHANILSPPSLPRKRQKRRDSQQPLRPCNSKKSSHPNLSCRKPLRFFDAYGIGAPAGVAW
jgi:hypothetical protein